MLTACSPPGTTVGEGPKRQEITGEFDGEASGDTGCAWIETDAAERIELLYPNGWRVEFDPPAVYDETGALRVEAGDTVVVYGSFGEVGASLCPADAASLVTDLRTQE